MNGPSKMTFAPSRMTTGIKSMATLKEKKSPFLNMDFIEEQNSRENKDFGLFDKENYQINPFNIMDTFEFVTPKVGEKPPVIDPKTVMGYDKIKAAILAQFPLPVEKPEDILKATKAVSRTEPLRYSYCEPKTTNQSYGWFIKHGPNYSQDNSDERFRFSHRTPDFIKEKARLVAADNVMGKLSKSGKRLPRPSDNDPKYQTK